MSYLPFALKYRPQTFDEIVGQEHVSQTLRNAVAQGRVHHAYLFAGPRGTGKTSTARVLAKALNCEHGPTPEPCGQCANCRAIQAGRFMDVIEIDAASHRGIDDIRDLREKVKTVPAEGRVKVYILDEAHQLTNDASNALLKTLEEPPALSYFVLATTEAHKFLPTIMSRCQRFDFRAIPPVAIAEALRHIAGRESVEIDEAALWTIAEAAGGAMRDAESIFDQVVAYAEGPIDRATVAAVLGLTQHELLERSAQLLGGGELAGLFALVDELIAAGKDLGQYLKDLTGFCGDLLRLELGAAAPAWAAESTEAGQAARALAASVGRRRLMGIIQVLTAASERLREGAAEVLTVELALAEAAEGSLPAPAPAPGTASVSPAAQAAAPPAAATGETPVVPESRPAPAPAPPAPAPAERVRPVATAPPIEGDLTLEVVQDRWRNMLREQLTRMKHGPVWAIVMEGFPTALTGTEVHLVFPVTHEFHYRNACGKHKPVIEEALSAILGQPVTIACSQGEVPSASGTTGVSPVAGAAEPTPPVGADFVASAPQCPPAPEAEPTGEPAPPAPRAHEDAVNDAVRRTLELFEGSQELPER
jgi:DNA polymerase-3 subunit gamma/tau